MSTVLVNSQNLAYLLHQSTFGVVNVAVQIQKLLCMS